MQSGRIHARRPRATIRGVPSDKSLCPPRQPRAPKTSKATCRNQYAETPSKEAHLVGAAARCAFALAAPAVASGADVGVVVEPPSDDLERLLHGMSMFTRQRAGPTQLPGLEGKEVGQLVLQGLLLLAEDRHLLERLLDFRRHVDCGPS
jgi:hypothetical protein